MDLIHRPEPHPSQQLPSNCTAQESTQLACWEWPELWSVSKLLSRPYLTTRQSQRFFFFLSNYPINMIIFPVARDKAGEKPLQLAWGCRKPMQELRLSRGQSHRCTPQLLVPQPHTASPPISSTPVTQRERAPPLLAGKPPRLFRSRDSAARARLPPPSAGASRVTRCIGEGSFIPSTLDFILLRIYSFLKRHF